MRIEGTVNSGKDCMKEKGEAGRVRKDDSCWEERKEKLTEEEGEQGKERTTPHCCCQSFQSPSSALGSL